MKRPIKVNLCPCCGVLEPRGGFCQKLECTEFELARRIMAVADAIPQVGMGKGGDPTDPLIIATEGP